MPEYDYFMVYELDNSGEKQRLDVKEEQLKDILNPEQVFVIVKEEIRRIFIWKGSKSPVRKRFISSRVAQALQEELIKEAAFHRCKIVSVDQGDEPVEFLNAFGLESMEVTEKLADMRYIRNIDRQKMLDKGEIPNGSPKIVKVEKVDDVETPMFEKLEKTKIIPLPSNKKQSISKTTTSSYKPSSYKPYSNSKKTKKMSNKFSELSDIEINKIKERILKTQIPNGYKRQNLILGHTLYGAIAKKINVFGKEIEEIEWEQIKKVPKEIIEIENHKLRVYFNEKKGIVEAIEVLEKLKNGEKIPENKTQSKKKSINYNAMTLNELKNYAKKNNIQFSANIRKNEIIKIIKDKMNKTVSKPARRRELPKIPSK
ncbi:MAG: hypothetical protein ACTSQJ_17575 [Promethearchaeota archaeon]